MTLSEKLLFLSIIVASPHLPIALARIWAALLFVVSLVFLMKGNP